MQWRQHYIDAVSDDEWQIPCKYSLYYVPQESGAVTVGQARSDDGECNGKWEEISNWQEKGRDEVTVCTSFPPRKMEELHRMTTVITVICPLKVM